MVVVGGGVMAWWCGAVGSVVAMALIVSLVSGRNGVWHVAGNGLPRFVACKEIRIA